MLENFLSRERARIANRLIPLQHRKGRILDIGCGEQDYFLSETEFNEKYGIDKMAKDKVLNNGDGEKIFIKKCDVEKDGLSCFDNEYFDVITMLAVLEHLESDRLPHIIKEVKRILKVSGVFILTIPSLQGDAVLHILSDCRMHPYQFLGELF